MKKPCKYNCAYSNGVECRLESPMCDILIDKNMDYRRAITMMNLFSYISLERQKIYILKKFGFSKPWTEDSVLQNWFFCNVFRQLDKTSEWMVKHIFKPNENNPDLWKYVILSRYISKIETFKLLLESGYLRGQFDFKLFNFMRALKKEGSKLFTKAFILNTGIGDGKFTDRITYIQYLIKKLDNVTLPLNITFDDCLRFTKLNQEVFNILKTIPGVGDFMAWQYLQDFHYTNRYMKKATDNETFVMLGIGAIRGMKHIFGINNYLHIKRNTFLYADLIKKYWTFYIDFCILAYKNYIRSLPHYDSQMIKEFDIFKSLKLCDVEHWLCEFDKYIRGGSKKRRYIGAQS